MTFVGCEAVTGGAGSLGCVMAAGAAGKLTTDALDGNIHGAGDVLTSASTGAVMPLLSMPLAAADLGFQGKAIVDNVAEGDYAGAAGHGALAALDAAAVVEGVRGLGCKFNSFTAVTPVLLADGDSKPIGEIKVGDKVLSTDPDTGDNTAEQVEVLHDNLDRDFVDLTVKLADGSSSLINTTAHHPFWDQTDRKWTDATDLKAGHHLRDANGRASVTVTKVHDFTGAHHVHNLTVANLHTYYVMAGKTPVLVHNCSEQEVADHLSATFPDRNIRQNRDVFREDGSPLTDHDVYDNDFICEVACGRGTGKVAQMQKNILPSANGTRVAVYGPKLKGSVVKGIEAQGVPVFRTLDELSYWVGSKS